MNPVNVLEPAVRDLLQEAAEWRMLELLFQCPGPEWKARVAELSVEVKDPEVRQAATLALDQAAEGVFHSIFGPGGPAPAREASYRDTIQLGHVMQQVIAFYQAFAYLPDTAEASDHASVEAGFIGYLRLKQAYAQASGDEQDAAVCQEAVQRFIQEHFSFVAEPLSAALDNSGEAYLELAGKALLRRVGPREKQLFDIVGQDHLQPDDSVFECGE